MTTNIRFFIGSLTVRIGDYENTVRNLVVANSETRAREILEMAAASYYGTGDEAREDDGFYANSGEVHTSDAALRSIGLATFLELQDILPVHRDQNIPRDLSADALTSKGFRAFASAVAKGCAAKGVEVTQAIMLGVLARALGEKNWHALSDKLSVKAVRESSTGLVQETTVDEPTGEPRSFDVEVCRSGMGFASFTVSAHSQAEAEALAIEKACDHHFTDRWSEYEVVGSSAK